MFAFITQQLYTYRVIVKFVIAGGSAALAQLAVLYLLTDHAGLWYVASSIVAFIVAVIISFSSHKFWTFRDNHWGALRKQFVLYISLQIANLIANTILIYVFVDILGVWYLFAQALISTLLAIISFLLYKHKIFIYSRYRLEQNQIPNE